MLPSSDNFVDWCNNLEDVHPDRDIDIEEKNGKHNCTINTYTSEGTVTEVVSLKSDEKINHMWVSPSFEQNTQIYTFSVDLLENGMDITYEDGKRFRDTIGTPRWE